MSYHDPVKAIGGGYIYYYDYGTASYGKWAYIYHADNWSSAYAHLCTTVFAQGQIVHQGDYIGDAGNTGNVGLSDSAPRCTPGFLEGGHLHFGAYIEPSQVSQNATVSNVSIGHLSDYYNTNYVSDNTGPGYFNGIQFNYYVRQKYQFLNGVLGSSWTPSGGYCNVQSRWYRDCPVNYWGSITTQNFLNSRTYYSSLVGGLSDVQLLWASIAKIYTYGYVFMWPNGLYVAEWLGRPVGDEQYACWGYSDTSCQFFQNGYMVKYSNPQPPDIFVYVCNPNCWLLATFNDIPETGP
jgi:hypothetical protein